MHRVSMAVCVAALAVLPACGSYQADATPPTVTYNYSDRDEYYRVAENADEYCDRNYDRSARLIDQDRYSGGYQATFSCE